MFPDIFATRCPRCKRGTFSEIRTRVLEWSCGKTHGQNMCNEVKSFHIIKEWQNLENWLCGSTLDDCLMLRRCRVKMFLHHSFNSLDVLYKTSTEEENLSQYIRNNTPSPPPYMVN